jgi:hypothetical protein
MEEMERCRLKPPVEGNENSRAIAASWRVNYVEEKFMYVSIC